VVALWRGDAYGGLLLASLSGLLAVGMTESLFDGPRITTLFFLLVLVGFAREGRDPESRRRSAEEQLPA